MVQNRIEISNDIFLADIHVKGLDIVKRKWDLKLYHYIHYCD